jgi:hypothetical protein
MLHDPVYSLLCGGNGKIISYSSRDDNPFGNYNNMNRIKMTMKTINNSKNSGIVQTIIVPLAAII